MKKYIFITTVVLAVGLTGCKKDYLSSLAVNPNNPSVTTPQYTLSAAEAAMANIIATDYNEYGVWGGYLAPSGDYTPSTELQNFSFSTGDQPGNDKWGALYPDLTNLNNLQTTSAADPSLANFEAIAMICKAYDFEELVDNYNDIVYDDAFKPSTILFPTYTKGQDVYNDLVKQLDAAISLINKTGAGATDPGSSDIIYGGNMGNWKKFANTIKLRLAIHQSNLTTNAAKDDLAATASEGYIDDNSEADAQPGYSLTVGKESPFYGAYGYNATGNATALNAEFRANAVDTNIMHALRDPRSTRFWALCTDPNDPSQKIVRGNVLGSSANLSNVFTSAIGPGLLQSPSQPSPVMASYESYFLQAEAVARGWIPGDAASLYTKGITASFNALGATGLTAYLAQGSVAYASAVTNGGGTLEAAVKVIVTQKYIAFNGNFYFEAYNDFRRTGYPVLPQNPASQSASAISPTLPTRIPYPASELNANGTNLAKEGTLNFFTSKIFWAK